MTETIHISDSKERDVFFTFNAGPKVDEELQVLASFEKLYLKLKELNQKPRLEKIQVPADKWSKFLAALEQAGAHVLSEQNQSQAFLQEVGFKNPAMGHRLGGIPVEVVERPVWAEGNLACLHIRVDDDTLIPRFIKETPNV